MSQASITQQQRLLLKRLERAVRRLRFDLRYYGSKDDDDLTALAAARIVRRDTYRRLFYSQPERLGGLVYPVARHTVVDLIRAESAAGRKKPPMVRDWEERLPAWERELAHRRLVQDVRRVLRGFTAACHSEPSCSRVRRQRMVAAFELYAFAGKTHGEVAHELGVPKSTVGTWLFAVKRYLAQRSSHIL